MAVWRRFRARLPGKRAAIDARTDRLSAAAERFRTDLAACDFDSSQPLGLAVSGGTDSLALLLIAHAAIPEKIAVASIDHQLRPEAASECEHVAGVCRQLSVPHITIPVTVGRGNTQAEARRARYEALARWARQSALPAIATAHQADDQAETLLMRLNRGAGLRGLAAMGRTRPVPGAPDVKLLRPLLSWRRSELAEICVNCGIEAIEDPSNSDLAFERVRIRDAVRNADWLDPAQLAASADHLRDALQALELLVEAEFADRVVDREDSEIAYRPSSIARQNRTIRFHMLEKILRRMGHAQNTPRGQEFSRLLDALEKGEKATLYGLSCEAREGTWHFRPEPPRRTG